MFGVQCRSCDLVFIDPQPSSEEIADLYSEEYFTTCSETCGAHGPNAYMDLAARGNAERIRGARRLDALIEKYVPERGRLIEVGCGPGLLLSEMRKLGWKVQGLEISEYAARFARSELGIDVATASIEVSSISPASTEVVFMGDVLEHLADPLAALRSVRKWLVPGGIVVIAVPSTLNLPSAQLGMSAYRLLRRTKTLRIPPYHLFEYTPRTLCRMIVAAGFELRELRQSAVPIGKMGLRGNPIENAGKVSLQLLAHLSARLLNCGGDRLLAVASRS